jgi:hypothetical protein
MAFLMLRMRVDDYDTWKRERFDADPAGRAQSAQAYRIMRNVDDPSEIFIQVKFSSVDEAKSFRERLVASGALEGMEIAEGGPRVTEEVDSETF